MKMVQNIVLTLVTVLTLSLSSCNPASVPGVTPDEIPVVATADEAQIESTTIIEETTAVTEETTVPETTATEVTEPTKAQEPEKTENKPVNNSSDKKQNNSNNSGNQTANKPSNNTSSNSSNTSTNKKPAETKPAEPKPVVITDDTPLTYDEFVNDKNIQRLCDDVNSYFIAKGMRYDTSVTIDNSGWFYGYNSASNVTAVRSYNQQKSRTITCLDEQVEACLVVLDGMDDYSTCKFNCYYGIDCNGYYNIYFAYR